MPIQEIGADVNDALLGNIVKLSEDQSYKALQAARSKQYIEGQARVARNESRVDIKKEQGVLDRIFGNATMQGADAQTAVQFADKTSLYLNSNMESFKSMSPEEFASTQADYVANEIAVSGNSDIDEYLTLASSEVIARASSVHAKHHELFLQEKNKLAFESTLSGSSEVFDQALNDPAQSFEDKRKALASLLQRSEPLPGQTPEAHKNSLVSIIVNDLNNNRPSMYNGAVKGSVDIDGNPIDIPHGIVFSLEQHQVIQDAYKKYQDRTDVDKKIQDAVDLSALHLAATDPAVGDTQFKQLATEYLGKKGADERTVDQLASMMNDRQRMLTQENDSLRGIQNINDGSSMGDPDRTKVAQSLGLLEQNIMQQARKAGEGKSEGVAQSLLANAKAAVLAHSIKNMVVPPTWAATWNTGLSNMLKTDGSKEVNPKFLETMQDFDSKYNAPFEAAKDLYSSSLDEKALANVEGVRLYMQSGMTAEEAVQYQSTHELTTKETEEYLGSAKYKKKIEKFLKDPDQMPWFKEMFVGEWQEIDNKAEVVGGLRHMVAATIARTGNSGDGTWKAATQEWKRTHEPIRSRAVSNRGVPLTQQAGVRDPSIKFNKIIDYYLATRGGESALPGEQKFGEGFVGDKADIRVDNNSISIIPRDSSGNIIPGSNGLPRRVSLKELGRIYNEEVIDQGILDKVGTDPLLVTRLIGAVFGKETIDKVKEITPMDVMVDPVMQGADAINAGISAIKAKLIRTPGKVGKTAVTTAVNRVEEVLGSTNGFLQRVAMVESKFGHDKNTFSGVSNGIWQVDDICLEETKRMTGTMQTAHAKIKEEFGIDWNDVTTQDLRKPLYGALAARLYLLQKPEEIPESIEGQAEYWKEHYNTKAGKGTTEDFKNRIL